MKVLATLIGLLAAIFLIAAPAAALDFTPSGSVLTVTYIEPSTNVAVPPATVGTPLDDLQKVVVNWRLCPTSGSCSSTYTAQDVPASSPTGGQPRSVQVTVPIAPLQANNVEVYAVAVDTSGNVSADSIHVTKRVDRLPPGSPS